MLKRSTLGIALLILLAIAGAYVYTKVHARNLPMTIHLSGDLTSSGGDRILAVDFDVDNTQIIQGTATYTYSERVENQRRDVTRKCSFANNEWNNETGVPCVIPVYHLPVSLTEFETQKQDGTVKPTGNDCRHLNICYSIETK